MKKDSFKTIQNEALLGNVFAKSNLADMYLSGNGIERNHQKAIQLYLCSAKEGVAEAQFRLGCLFFDGFFVPQSIRQSLGWLSQAAEQGHIKAQLALAAVFKSQRDDDQAYQWLKRAALNGDCQAKDLLMKGGNEFSCFI